MKIREIKFRVFDKISKQMYRWSQIASISLVDFDKEHYELMQYTGLKDKKGIEVYEGDLILDEEYDDDGNNISSKLEVLYDIETAQYVVDNSYAKTRTSLVSVVGYMGKDNLLVIGNIYEK